MTLNKCDEGFYMRFKLTVYDGAESITYESCDANKIIEQIKSIAADSEDCVDQERTGYTKPLTPYERCRNAVYATGNVWAIENFNATH